MSTVTENDLKRIEDLIISGQKTLENRLSALEVGQGEIKVEIKALENRLSTIEIGQAEIKGEIKTLDAKTNGISDRLKIVETSIGKIPDLAEKVGELKNWRQFVIIAITSIISSAVTWFIRGVNLKP